MKDRGRSVVERFLSPYFGRTKDARVYRILRRRTYADRMDLENLAAARWYLLIEILFCIFCTIHKFLVFWVERGKERQVLRSVRRFAVTRFYRTGRRLPADSASVSDKSESIARREKTPGHLRFCPLIVPRPTNPWYRLDVVA